MYGTSVDKMRLTYNYKFHVTKKQTLLKYKMYIYIYIYK